MKNFVLENPTKIIFGKGTIAEIGPEAKAIGSKALLVYGRGSIRANGVHDQVTASLRDAGCLWVEHGGVKSNPVLSHVRQGVALARSEQVDLVLAVGGGSVIDTAKAIAAGATVNHDVWKIFTAKKGVRSPLPVCCVLTLAASGSEMNGGMVITNDEKGLKLGAGHKDLKPRVSILDPEATFSVPPDYTAYGAVDAIAHILEFYFSCQGSFPVQERFMEGLVINIMESGAAAVRQPTDYTARANLMWCATLALNGWTAAGLGLVGFPMHMIEHAVSALYDVPHGAGLSCVIPAWMRWRSGRSPAKFAQLARRVFAVQATDDAEAAARGIDRLEAWFKTVRSPTRLSELGVDQPDIAALTAHALTQAKIWRLRGYNEDNIAAILAKAL